MIERIDEVLLSPFGTEVVDKLTSDLLETDNDLSDTTARRTAYCLLARSCANYFGVHTKDYHFNIAASVKEAMLYTSIADGRGFVTLFGIGYTTMLIVLLTK